MLHLIEMTARNFRGLRYVHLVGMNTSGLTLISGANGSGKSSARNIVEYLLLDTTLDDHPLDELTLNKEGDCVLQGVIFNDVTDDTITITKYREHSENKNFTKLVLNDTDISSTDRRVTQKSILDLLGISEDTLFISTIFAKNSPSFPEASESTRKTILYDAMNLNKYNVYLERVKQEISNILDKQKSKFNRVDFLKSLTEDKKKELSDLIEKIENFNKEKDIRIEKLKESKELLITKDVSKLKEKLGNQGFKIIEYIDSTEELDDERYELISKKSEIETNITTIKKKLIEADNNTCPILKHKCVELVSTHSQTKEDLDNKLIALQIALKNILDTLDILDKKKKEITDAKDYNNSLINKVNVLETEIRVCETFNNGIEDKRKSIDREINDISESENPYIDMKKTIGLKLIEIENEIKSIEEEVYDLNEDLKYYKFWEVGFGKSGIPNLKIGGFLESLELKTNEILSQISDRMHVEITDQSTLKSNEVREKISYKVFQPDKKISDFHSYSEGQKQRVRLADIFAFNSLLGKFSMVILDEVLEGSLDGEGKEATIRFLKKKALEIGSLFVISHDQQIKDAFDNVINVEEFI